jgi:chromosome segregation ATPase
MSIRTRLQSTARFAGALLVLLATSLPSWAQQQDRQAERAARRQQQQLQGLQQQLQASQAEKTKADTERAELAKKLAGREQVAARASALQRAADEKLKAANDEKESLLAKVAELQKQLDERGKSSEQALAEKDKALAQAAQQLKTQEAAQGQLQSRFGDQVRLVTECTDKNDRLTRLSAELMDRWRKKGFADALRQREPVLGLGDVELFNQIQEYRDKADAERFVPNVERR